MNACPQGPYRQQRDEPVELPRGRRLRFFPLVCVIFFTVSGGAFGIEPIAGAVVVGSVAASGAVLYFVRRKSSASLRRRKQHAQAGNILEFPSEAAEEIAWRFLRRENRMEEGE